LRTDSTKKYYAYDINFQPIGILEGHYMAIVAKPSQPPNPPRRSHRIAARARLLLTNFIDNTTEHGGQHMQDPDGAMLEDNTNVMGGDLEIDLNMAFNILNPITLIPECTNWELSYGFLVR
jgi:hypothetical protein